MVRSSVLGSPAVRQGCFAGLASPHQKTLLLRPPHCCVQESKYLLGQKRGLQSELSQTQREASALAAQVQDATALAAQLKEAQSVAAAAQAAADAARGRNALVEKAWSAALEVSC